MKNGMHVIKQGRIVIDKLIDAQNYLLKLGRTLTALSFIGAVISVVLGKPQWKWLLSVVVGGLLLVSVEPIVKWIVTL